MVNILTRNEKSYQKPLYQVLALPPAAEGAGADSPRLGQTLSVGDILRRACAGGGAV